MPIQRGTEPPRFPGSFNPVAITVAVTATNFKNHGAYVSSQGSDDDAAHSCIGMPIK